MRTLRILLGICCIATLAHADDWSQKTSYGSSSSVVTGMTLNQLLQAMQKQAESATIIQPRLDILSGYCGANGSWRDVTGILQRSIKNDSLHVDWKQPYREIGGDPAFGKIKLLVIAFRLNGQNRIAVSQEENPPIGLVLSIP